MSDPIPAFSRLMSALEDGSFRDPAAVAKDCDIVLGALRAVASGTLLLHSRGFAAGRVLLEVEMVHISGDQPTVVVEGASVIMNDMTDESRTFIEQGTLALDPGGIMQNAIQELKGT